MSYICLQEDRHLEIYKNLITILIAPPIILLPLLMTRLETHKAVTTLSDSDATDLHHGFGKLSVFVTRRFAKSLNEQYLRLFLQTLNQKWQLFLANLTVATDSSKNQTTKPRHFFDSIPNIHTYSIRLSSGSH